MESRGEQECKIETRHENQHSGRQQVPMHRVSSAINWSATARYMTSNNYRKWNLVGGKGGPPEQLVDSDAATVYMHIGVRG